MAAREQIPLEPPLAEVFAQDFHHAAVRGSVLVGLQNFTSENAVCGLEHGAEAIGFRFIRTEHAEIPLLGVELDHVSQETAHHARRFRSDGAGPGHFDSVITEVRHFQVPQHKAAIGVRIGAHSSVALWSKFGQFGFELAVFLEQLFGLVASHPFFQQLQMPPFVSQIRERHLVRAPGTLRRFAIHLFWSSPTFGTAENDHRPDWAPLEPILARARLNDADLVEHLVERASHPLVHQGGLVAFYEIRFVTVAAEKLLQLLMADAGQNCRVGDFVTIQVQNGKEGAIIGWI